VISPSTKDNLPNWSWASYSTPRMFHAQKSGARMRPSQTFQKRQKELARQEKQRAKAQRKAQRKLEKQAPAEDIVHRSGESSCSPDGDIS
jgi:hypothetical protein